MNRVILITGANNGIGLETAKALLAQGERVAGLDLAIENLSDTKLCLPNLLPFVCDVTDTKRVQEVVDDVVRIWGGVDILINNACLASFMPFDTFCLNDIRREFEVNYFGYLNLIWAVLPVMKKQGYGIVHNVSSGGGLHGHARNDGLYIYQGRC